MYTLVPDDEFELVIDEFLQYSIFSQLQTWQRNIQEQAGVLERDAAVAGDGGDGDPGRGGLPADGGQAQGRPVQGTGEVQTETRAVNEILYQFSKYSESPRLVESTNWRFHMLRIY